MSLFAGSLQRFGSQDGVGVAAQFFRPHSVAQDAAGNIYVADSDNHTIRKLSPDGRVTTVAGAAGQEGSADGTGAAARFSFPRAIVVDAAGNLYVADRGNHTIRKINPAGTVSTLAGLAGQSGAVNGPGATARFRSPIGLALDLAGNLLVAEKSGAIRKVTADGTVSSFVGKLGETGFVSGNGDQARFEDVLGVAVDGAGNVYVAELRLGVNSVFGRVRKFDSQARSVAWGSVADGVVAVGTPTGIAADAAGNVYLASSAIDTSFPSRPRILNRILLITPLATIASVAGQDEKTGSADGPGAAATFGLPRGLAVGQAGRIIVADTDNHAVREIDAQGVVSTLAGGSGIGLIDAQGAAARFSNPGGIAAAPDGTLYVADGANRVVRKLSPAGVVSTVPLTNPDGSPGVFGGGVSSVALSAGGALYVEISSGPLVRWVDVIEPSGQRRQFAQSFGVSPIAADPAGRLILGANSTVVRVDAAGNRQDLATGFSGVAAVAAKPSNLVYVADADHTVRAIDAQGVVSLLAGEVGIAGNADGAGVQARFDRPSSLALDDTGNLYVADSATVRKVTPQGVVSTIAVIESQPGGMVPGSIAMLPGRVKGLAWTTGALYATVMNAVVRIAPLP